MIKFRFPVFVLIVLVLSFTTVAQQRLPLPPAGVATPRTTFIVNTTTDAVDSTPGDGICSTGGSACTLRAAIMEANAIGAAVIEMIPSGSFSLTLAGTNEDLAATGDLDITGAVILRGNGAQISTALADRMIDVRPGAMLIMSDLLLLGSGSFLALEGGCLRVGANAVMSGERLNFRQCYANRGGAVIISGDWATVDLSQAAFAFNTANTGGALATASGADDVRITIDRSEFSFNQALDGDGGAIHINDSRLTLTNTILARNTVSNVEIGGRGGGLFFDSVSSSHHALLQHVTVYANTAEVAGGGFYVQGTENRLDLVNSLVTDNTAPLGTDCATSATFAAALYGPSLISDLTDCPIGGATPLTGSGLVYPATVSDSSGFNYGYYLRPDSPAIDTGSFGGCIDHDRAGMARPFGAACDLGALESTNLTRNGSFEQDCAAAPWKISSTKDKVRPENPSTGLCALRLIGKPSKLTTPTVIKQTLKPKPGVIRDGDSLRMLTMIRGVTGQWSVAGKFVYSDGTKSALPGSSLSFSSSGVNYFLSRVELGNPVLNNGDRTLTKIVLKISDKTTSGTWYIDDLSVLVIR
jgi:CSLREA domain-containing protein